MQDEVKMQDMDTLAIKLNGVVNKYAASNNATIDQLKKNIKYHEDLLTKYQRAVEQTLAALVRESETLRKIEEAVSKDVLPVEECRQQLEDMKKLKNVKSIKIEGSTLIVHTAHLDFECSGVWYIGSPYVISLELASQAMRISATDRPGVYNYQHPHVRPDRSVCLGNACNLVTQMLTNLQYFQFIAFMIEFLQTMTPQDSYLRILNNYHWERKEDKDGKSKT